MTVQELVIAEMLKEDSSLRKQDITTFTVSKMALKLVNLGLLEVNESGELVVVDKSNL